MITLNEAVRHGRGDEASGPGDLPEPSPLFWTHFPGRVRTALDNAVRRDPAWWTGGVNSRWAGLALTATLVAGVMAGFALSRQPFSGWTDRGVASAEAESGPVVEFADAGGGVARPESWTSVADPEWAMVLLMAETARWDGREATAIFVADGAADRAIFELSAEERLELKRLIELEIGANEAEAS